jgi:F0F1-type ATP synthase assembly protein I
MTYLIIKAVVSGVLVMIISEVARRSPGLGGLIASLPLVSVLGIIWLWRDTSDLERIASHAEATFWFVLPSLPMFLAFPTMLRHGIGFWLVLILSCALTMVLYLITVWILPKIGITI